MAEPLFRALTPDGRVSVEVRVPNESPEDGVGVLFTCLVTVDSKTVMEELVTDDQQRMLSWVKRQMTEAMRRSAIAP